MRYEVWCGAVKVYESDLEAAVRVLVDGIEVYTLNGTPIFQEGEAGFTRIVEGGSTEATYVSSTGKEHKVIDEAWTP